MTSLVLTRWHPQDCAGGSALRSCQTVHALARLGPVDVACIGDSAAAVPVEGLRQLVAFSRTDRGLSDRLRARSWPVRAGAFNGSEHYRLDRAVRWVREHGAAYDVAVLESLSLAPYLDAVKRGGCRVVFDAHNVEGALHDAAVSAEGVAPRSPVRRVKDAVVGRRLAQAERRVVRAADLVWACSPGDARALEARYRPAAPVSVVPNGVDVEAYSTGGAAVTDGDWHASPVTLLYAGLFGYTPNADAAMRLIREVLPRVRATRSDARLLLVGRSPTPAMLAAAAADAAIEVTGKVDTVLPYLERRCVVCLPITVGSGTRLKIVEAFAALRPVVSSAKAAEGLEVSDGVHLLLREEPEAMAAAAIAVWDSSALRAGLCREAHALARDHYSWTAAARRIAESLEAAGPRTGPFAPGVQTGRVFHADC